MMCSTTDAASASAVPTERHRRGDYCLTASTAVGVRASASTFPLSLSFFAAAKKVKEILWLGFRSPHRSLCVFVYAPERSLLLRQEVRKVLHCRLQLLPSSVNQLNRYRVESSRAEWRRDFSSLPRPLAPLALVTTLNEIKGGALHQWQRFSLLAQSNTDGDRERERMRRLTERKFECGAFLIDSFSRPTGGLTDGWNAVFTLCQPPLLPSAMLL